MAAGRFRACELECHRRGTFFSEWRMLTRFPRKRTWRTDRKQDVCAADRTVMAVRTGEGGEDSEQSQKGECGRRFVLLTEIRNFRLRGQLPPQALSNATS